MQIINEVGFITHRLVATIRDIKIKTLSYEIYFLFKYNVVRIKSIKPVAAPALTSPQPLSKGEGLEPALVKVSKRFNNFYPDNSDLSNLFTVYQWV